MKKLTIILIVILVGIFMLNAIQTQVKATIHADQTIGLVFGMFNENFQKMTSGEKNLLYSRCGEQDIKDATTLIRLWGALLRVTTESQRIIDGR